MNYFPIPATDFRRDESHNVGENLNYGGGIITNWPPEVDHENIVTYDVTIDEPGRYEISVDYAALLSRPVTVDVNGTLVTNSALAGTTGGWTWQNITHATVGSAAFKMGLNKLRITRYSAIPHIRRIYLTKLAQKSRPRPEAGTSHRAKRAR